MILLPIGDENPALLTVFPATEGGLQFVRGDANADGQINITDGVFILDFLFGGATVPCREAANAGGGDDLNISDGIFLLQFLFSSGSPPPAPYPDCGSTGGDVDCASFDPCA